MQIVTKVKINLILYYLVGATNCSCEHNERQIKRTTYQHFNTNIHRLTSKKDLNCTDIPTFNFALILVLNPRLATSQLS